MHRVYERIQEFLENYRQQLPEPDPEWPHEVRRAVKFIYEHLFDPKLSVTWLKEQCKFNGKSFSAEFCWYVGYYPKEYINHHRIETAKLLLKQTEVTITQIALSVGFASLSSFCKTFKEKEDGRPMLWRKRAKIGKACKE